MYDENRLQSLSGRGRALISEPGNSDRVTIDFNTTRQKSLLTIRNRIGIKGGQILVDEDSVLIYDQIENFARQVSVYDAGVSNLNELASVNILDLMNYTFSSDQVLSITENERFYRLLLDDGATVMISRKDGTIQQVYHNPDHPMPYSKILYEGYGEIEGYTFPRKITIFSSDERSRVAFLVQSLKINPGNLKLSIDIPDNVRVIR